MNALEALTGVTPMQLATILKGVTPALATLGILAMDFLAQVSSLIITVQICYNQIFSPLDLTLAVSCVYHVIVTFMCETTLRWYIH